MKRALALLLLGTAACGRASLEPGQGATVYTLPDWSSPAQGGGAAPSVSAATAAFRAAVPAGYRRSDGVMSAPVAGMFVKDLPGGEAAVVVERYTEKDGGPDKETFVRNLNPGGQAFAVTRHTAGRAFEVYEGIEFHTLTRRISPSDPYADRLGTAFPPPRLSFLESRRFPPGGDAYRLYRCRKEGAWSLLRKYRRLREKDGDLAEFRSKDMGSAERQIVSACFGNAALLSMDTGADVPDVPKPSMYRLRIMAREEWVYGASRRVEREAVHLRDIPGGFYAVRLRAPRASYYEELPVFVNFLAGFEPVAAP